MNTYDVAIAGGGIIGCSIAFELAGAGLRVVVLDRQEPGREASWAAAGMLSPGPDAPGALPLVPLAKESHRRYPAFVAQIENASLQPVAFARNGTLEVFSGADADAARDAMVAQYASLAIPCEAISLAGAHEREPSLGPEIPAAAWLPDEATIEPRALIRAVIAACKRRGVEFRSGRAVTEILRNATTGAVAGVQTGNEKIHTEHVVVAAGSFCASFTATAPTHPVKGQILALRHPTLRLARVLRSEKAYVVPRRDGRLIAGSTLENVGFDKEVTSEGMHKILDGVREIVPALVDAEIVETWAGLRPGTPDGLPILGETATKNLIVATGHYRNGILLAPATAAIVRDIVITGKTNFDISAYSAQRFAGASEHSSIVASRSTPTAD
jgi:glycine oxidase